MPNEIPINDGMINDGQKGPGFDMVKRDNDNLQARSARASAAAMEQVRLRQERTGRKYAELVPGHCQALVAKLITDSYPMYAEHFAGRAQFAEAFCQNWLAQREAFGMVLTEAGFNPVSDTGDPRQLRDPNAVNLAVLTMSSSYLFFSPGGFDRDGTGAAMDYRHMPLRNSPGLREATFQSGVYFNENPQVGRRLEVERPDDDTWRSSPAEAIYYKGNLLEDEDAGRERTDLELTVHTVLEMTNQTILGPRGTK